MWRLRQLWLWCCGFHFSHSTSCQILGSWFTHTHMLPSSNSIHFGTGQRALVLYVGNVTVGLAASIDSLTKSLLDWLPTDWGPVSTAYVRVLNIKLCLQHSMIYAAASEPFVTYPVANQSVANVVVEENGSWSRQWQFRQSWRYISCPHSYWKAQVFNTVHEQLLLPSSVSSARRFCLCVAYSAKCYGYCS